MNLGMVWVYQEEGGTEIHLGVLHRVGERELEWN